ncbi:MAG TPA: hypothetical protein VES42_06420 [Pilimelia sp.]|nr:hypothetical protein [Pilimelia sp.]
MAQWAVLLDPARFEAERLFHHDTLDLPPDAAAAPGDEVVVLAGGAEPAVVALGRVVDGRPGLAVAYTRRAFDDPQPAGPLALAGPLSRLAPATFGALAGRVAGPRDRRTWLVSVDLPIEAESPAEAVGRFWSYVRELGPRELPAFVAPTDDELAMQAYVLGEPANLDPEEDDDDQG